MGLFDSDNSMYPMLDQLANNRTLYNNIDLPEYRQFSPEQYDNESATAKLTSEDPVMKSKQLEVLARMNGMSSTGMSDQDVAGFEAAKSAGNQLAQGREGAAIQDAQARGVAGGGTEFAMREAANQAGAQRAQEAALAQAAQASNNRNSYMQAYANQLGSTRQQDYNTNAANTNALNQFNMANTQARNATNQANTGLQNQAFQYNEGLKDKNYSNQLGQADRLAGINTQQGQMTAAQVEAERRRNSALTGLAGAGIGAAVGPGGASVGYGIGSSLG